MLDVEKIIVDVIKENFPNGIRDDFIDINKVLRICRTRAVLGAVSQKNVVDIIRANGLESDGRFYFFSDADAVELRRFFDKIFDAHDIVYYSEVCRQHSNFLARLHIFSPEVLRKTLQSIDDEHFYFAEFCSSLRAERLEHQLDQIFSSTEQPLSIDELRSKLPYVPKEVLSELLSNEKNFVRTKAGDYHSVLNIRFDLKEIYAAQRRISRLIDANDFAAPDDYDLSSNFALNPELTEKVLRDVIFDEFFSADFSRQCKRLFKKDVVNNRVDSGVATDRLRDFLADRKYISVDKLFDFAKDAGIYPPNSVRIACEKMIRAEHNLFVADSLIRFDVDAGDDALSPFVQGKIIPIRAVNSFTGFPPVEGHPWNLFLLESFLRRFSSRYSFSSPSDNSSNVGAIHPRSMRFQNYLDVQAAAIIQENVPLEKSAVENFLVERGYRTNRIDRVTYKIIERALQEISRR